MKWCRVPGGQEKTSPQRKTAASASPVVGQGVAGLPTASGFGQDRSE